MKSLLALLAAAAIVLLSSSCTNATTDDGHAAHGTDTTAPPQAPAPFNAADVTFATDMIPHHQQAVDLSALVPARSTDPAVIKLAADIAAAQGPEIQTMKAFLVQWNAGESDHQGHGDMPGMAPGAAMDGMVDTATMTKLESLQGKDFDTLWLQSMIGHHEGAIKMAQTELASGGNADAKTLAQQIITAQQGEIVSMKQMLGG